MGAEDCVSVGNQCVHGSATAHVSLETSLWVGSFGRRSNWERESDVRTLSKDVFEGVSDNFNSIRTSLPRVVSLCLVFPSRSLSCAVLALLVRVSSFGLDSVTPTLDVAQGRRSVTLKSVLTCTYQLAG